MQLPLANAQAAIWQEDVEHGLRPLSMIRRTITPTRA